MLLINSSIRKFVHSYIYFFTNSLNNLDVIFATYYLFSTKIFLVELGVLMSVLAQTSTSV